MLSAVCVILHFLFFIHVTYIHLVTSFRFIILPSCSITVTRLPLSPRQVPMKRMCKCCTPVHTCGHSCSVVIAYNWKVNISFTLPTCVFTPVIGPLMPTVGANISPLPHLCPLIPCFSSVLHKQVLQYPYTHPWQLLL